MAHSERLANIARKHNAELALRYANASLYIFPCNAARKEREPHDRLPFGKADKRPLVEHWAEEASKDPQQIVFWWQKFPGALIGLPCKQNRLFVIDCDRHTAEANGIETFAALYTRRESLPRHPIIKTDYQGEHHIFRMPNPPIGQRNSALPAGIDIRGYRIDNAGGYVIGSGSMMADGRCWRRIPGTPPLLEAPLPPHWLIELCQLRPSESHDEPIIQVSGDGWLRALARLVAGASVGERNKLLFWAACRAAERVREGVVSPAFITAVLIEASARAGLPRREAQGTIQSALRTVRA